MSNANGLLMVKICLAMWAREVHLKWIESFHQTMIAMSRRNFSHHQAFALGLGPVGEGMLGPATKDDPPGGDCFT